ncbi:MAG: DUF1361 domain-containing protein [Verrucomicrobiota bacterium]
MNVMSRLLRGDRALAIPVLSLMFASLVCMGFVLVRVGQTGNPRYISLLWNLFLAWLPLVFAVQARRYDRLSTVKLPLLILFTCLWLLFFPNAPYIFTDLIHLTTRFFGVYWIDLAMVLTCALTGLVLGFVSLYLMQEIVARRYGRWAGWGFIAVSTALGSFGIFLGRFLRFNSWDVVVSPGRLYQGVGAWTSQFLNYPRTIGFPLAFAAFLFTAYLMLYALTQMPRAGMSPMPAEKTA